MADYGAFPNLRIDVQDGIALVTMDSNTSPRARAALHGEVSRVWPVLGEDSDVRVVIITGTGDQFYFSGQAADFRKLPSFSTQETFEIVRHIQREANDLVYGMVNLDKPIISAINGKATGAGLAVALMADIPIAAEDAPIIDPHIALGIAAGDHAAMIWPLLCGMAKAKLYLLTSDELDGREAERIGLVSLAVPGDRLMDTAFEYARKLADGPQHAIHFTKRSLNQWLRLGGITGFDYSLALEMLGFFSPEVPEAVEKLARQGG